MSSRNETDGTLRATYSEIELGGARVARIADPANVDAWIQSDVTRPVRD